MKLIVLQIKLITLCVGGMGHAISIASGIAKN